MTLECFSAWSGPIPAAWHRRSSSLDPLGLKQVWPPMFLGEIRDGFQPPLKRGKNEDYGDLGFSVSPHQDSLGYDYEVVSDSGSISKKISLHNNSQCFSLLFDHLGWPKILVPPPRSSSANFKWNSGKQHRKKFFQNNQKSNGARNMHVLGDRAQFLESL